jgi:hypothetical protein
MTELDSAVDTPYAIAGTVLGASWSLAAYTAQKFNLVDSSPDQYGVAALTGVGSTILDYSNDSDYIHPELTLTTISSAAMTYEAAIKADEKIESWLETDFEDIREELEEDTLSDLPKMD